MVKPVPVESFLDIRDQNRWWFYIPGFNGYEISNDGYVRSMKHFKRYPFGMLIRPKARANENDPTFELTNNDNERVAVRLSQLSYLAKNNPYGVSGFPRLTCITDIAPRNQRAFIKKKITTPPVDNTARYPKFTITASPDDVYDCEDSISSVQVPIKSIDGSEYYGRKDCRAIFR